MVAEITVFTNLKQLVELGLGVSVVSEFTDLLIALLHHDVQAPPGCF
jgi:hypothetical protein